MKSPIPAEHLNSLALIPKSEGQFLVCFRDQEWTFDYYLNKKNSNTLLVFLPSAAVNGERILPAFRRWRWSLELEGYDVLCVADPAMRLSEKLLGAWCVGTRNSWPLPLIMNHIAQLKATLGYTEIVFCGSSLGGFMALQMGTLAKEMGLDLGTGGVYAENPQVNLMTYYQGPADLIAEVGFGVPNRNMVAREFEKRFNVTQLMFETGLAPDGYLVVKESDEHHFNNHLPQLIDALEQLGATDFEIEVIPKEVDDTGHSALTLPEMMTRVEHLLSRNAA
jgi:pimeloyl-ACP methyl ester carboxylesterase